MSRAWKSGAALIPLVLAGSGCAAEAEHLRFHHHSWRRHVHEPDRLTSDTALAWGGGGACYDHAQWVAELLVTAQAAVPARHRDLHDPASSSVNPKITAR